MSKNVTFIKSNSMCISAGSSIFKSLRKCRSTKRRSSCLKTFYFYVFINDLPSNVPASEVVIYADYTSQFMSHWDLKQLDDYFYLFILFYYCVEVAHDSELFSSKKLLCNRNRTQQILRSLSDKSEYQSVKSSDLILTAGWIGECT